MPHQSNAQSLTNRHGLCGIFMICRFPRVAEFDGGAGQIMQFAQVPVPVRARPDEKTVQFSQVMDLGRRAIAFDEQTLHQFFDALLSVETNGIVVGQVNRRQLAPSRSEITVAFPHPFLNQRVHTTPFQHREPHGSGGLPAGSVVACHPADEPANPWGIEDQCAPRSPPICSNSYL